METHAQLIAEKADDLILSAAAIYPLVVLTGYKDFSFNSQNLSIQQIHDLLTTFGEPYKGCVLFNSAEILWQEQLSNIIDALTKSSGTKLTGESK